MNPFRSVIQASAFIRKETFEIFRQPRLLVTLVLGPFAILLLFGIGYRNEGRKLKTLFVAPANQTLRDEISKIAPSVGKAFEFAGIIADENQAVKRLRNGQVDLVVVVPADALQAIRDNRQAVFTLYHNEIDPYQTDYIRFMGELYVNKVNNYVLNHMADRRRKDIYDVLQDLHKTDGALQRLRTAYENNDMEGVLRGRQDLDQKLGLLQGRLQQQGKEAQALTGGGAAVDRASQKAESDTAARIREFRAGIAGDSPEKADFRQAAQQIADIQQSIAVVENDMARWTKIDPEALFSPFRSQTVALVKLEPSVVQFFTPGVIALLLQHLAVTLAALSLVREFRTGTVELYRAAPLTTGQTLVGKLLAYLVIGLLVAAVLTVLVIFGLKMPMRGNWYEFSAVVFTLFFTSLAVGFFLSVLSRTETEAIQYSMIFLLLTIFFSGFLMNLQLMWPPVRAISWGIPAAYAIKLLQNIMLRGYTGDWLVLGILAAIGLALLVFTHQLLERKMSRL